jgi:Zn-dependent protease with chaperone function
LNFFEHQDEARRSTRRLMLLFSIAVFLLLVITNVVLIGSFWLFDASIFQNQDAQLVSFEQLQQNPELIKSFFDYFNWKLILKVSSTVIAVILFVILLKRSELSGGGMAIATRLGGKKILLDTESHHERKILNIVQEMAIASGVAVPPVYLLPENGINAFAAGYNSSDAVIGISKGAIEKLNRDQLQGVIAHEFSHIFNGDMRLNINLIAVLSGILFIGHSGHFIMRAFSVRRYHRSSKNSGAGIAIVLVGLLFVLIGFIGTIFGKLIKSAVSRQREFLADASAVQFTRNPEGISGALKLIGGYSYGSRMDAYHVEEMSHLFFSSALNSKFANVFASWFSTHPPLEERIRRVEPYWDGHYLRMSNEDSMSESETSINSSGKTQEEKLKVVEAAVLAGAVSGLGANQHEAENKKHAKSNLSLLDKTDDLTESVDHVGEINKQHWNSAKISIQAIASDIKNALHKPAPARAVIYLMLLDTSLNVRNKQLSYIQDNESTDVKIEMENLSDAYKELAKHERLNTLELAIPALKEMDKDKYKIFIKNIVFLVKADKKISLFEWLLHALLIHYLKPQFGKVDTHRAKYKNLKKLRNECRFLLSHLCYFGKENSATGFEQAFDSGFKLLELGESSIISRDQLSLEDLNNALHHFAHLYPLVKPRLLKACAACIQADKTLTIEQYDLLRAISALIDCPMPLMNIELKINEN